MSNELQAFVAADPWDLMDEGVDHVLDRISGEIDVNGIQTTVVADPVHVFRPHANVSPRTYRCDAAAYFQPQGRRYADSRLRPAPAAWLKSRNPLEQITDACRRRGLRLRARVVACDSPTLVERYPFAASKDAFGDASSARLCPCNPDVRAYLAGLVDDLSENYGIEIIDLAEADFGCPQQFHAGRLNPAYSESWRATTLCFCESCRQAAASANLDINALAQEIQSRPASTGANDRMRALYDMRSDAVARLVTAARTATRGQLWLEIRDAEAHRGRSHDYPAMEITGCLIQSDFSDVPAVSPTDTDRPQLGRTIQRTNPSNGIICPVGCQVAIAGGSAPVVRFVVDLARDGHRLFVFESYGLLPDERFDWLRQAIRFARRDTESA